MPSTEPIREQARLIPVSGIGTVQEAEQRATSAFLAVLSVVRDLSLDLLSPFGASKAQKATVETFIEIRTPGQKIRPDGLIEVGYSGKTWSAFVEVKTGPNTLQADQINSYWDLARDYGVGNVLTISNEIAPQEGLHPTAGLKVRANSKVGVYHLSWSAIAFSAKRIKRHKGVSDPEQAWLLDELIRYLKHKASGALDFADMGAQWVGVRDATREETLTRRSSGIEDVVGRWDQLLRFAALQLSAEIGEDVDPIVPRGQTDHRQRSAGLAESLCESGRLAGALRIPNTAGDLVVEANVRSRRLTAYLDVAAPTDRGAKGRVSWLVNQLTEAPGQLLIEVYARNARTPTSATLDQIREDRLAPLDGDKKEPHRFRIVMRSEMGMGRAAATKSPGFITSVLQLINTFYGAVVQDVAPWQPPAPKLTKPMTPGPDEDKAPSEVLPEPQTFRVGPVERVSAVLDRTGRGGEVGAWVGGRVLMVLALVLVVGCVDHGPAGLQTIADEAAELRGGYGFLVAVIDGEGGRTVGIAGTDATGAPLTEDVTWRIGSVTKAFVAVVIMQLVDEGHLSLDDSASIYLDHDFVPAEATIFDLLHHSSGIPDYVEDETWVEVMRSCPGKAPYPYDFVDEGSLFEPGSQWKYSNTNYLLLGEIIATVTSLPPETAIRHRILEPLGLTDTYTAHVEKGRPPVPAVADFFDTGPGPIECETAPISGVAGTDGGMVSSVDDLDLFYRALFAGELVSDESLSAMAGEEYVGSEVSGHGLGLIHLLEPPTADVDIWANGGGVVGYKTLLMYDLESDTTVIVMTPTGRDPSEQEDILRWAFG